MEQICVVGAGSSGLAMCRELARRGISFQCFERGSEVGGNWRYNNDNEASAAYASLRTNVSRRRMEYPSTPLPRSAGVFVHHGAMATYLSAYADTHGIRPHLSLRTTVERARPCAEGGWLVTVRGRDGGAASTQRYGALIVANGHDWAPNLPEIEGQFDGMTMHTQAYRTPEPFAGKRVVVVGMGNSAGDVAAEVSQIASRTYLAFRRSAHVVPRYLGGRPLDDLNGPLINRLPWRVIRGAMSLMVSLSSLRGLQRAGFPPPDHRILMDVPTVSSTLLPAVRRGAVLLRPAPVRFAGHRVVFSDGSEVEADAVIFGTGYRIALPFLDPEVLAALQLTRKEISLYRRIVSPSVPGLFFVGLIDAAQGLLPLVEAQASWIGEVFDGWIRLPDAESMRRAAEVPERRTRVRFPSFPARSVVCDGFAYLRVVKADLRRARLRCFLAHSRLQVRPGVFACGAGAGNVLRERA